MKKKHLRLILLTVCLYVSLSHLLVHGGLLRGIFSSMMGTGEDSGKISASMSMGNVLYEGSASL